MVTSRFEEDQRKEGLMLITRVRASNWRNFSAIDIPLKEFTYFVGANGAGKSSLLDIPRFLGDICREGGGGLQGALKKRGGLAYVRSLLNTSDSSKKGTSMSIDVELSEKADGPVIWRYMLALRMEGQGRHRDLVAQERVWKNGKLILSRPTAQDRRDMERLTQTQLEQAGANGDFRELAEFFRANCCLLPVFSLPREGETVNMPGDGTRVMGYGLMDRIMQVQDSARHFRMNTIGRMMQLAIPGFSELFFWRDDSGSPYLEAKYATHRQRSLQTDEWFTDDMLRMIDFFWSTLDDLPLLMVDEPEKYLPDALMQRFPAFLVELRRLKKDKTYRMMPQMVMTTNSSQLLASPGIDPASVIVLEAGRAGSTARTLKAAELAALKSGEALADVLMPLLQAAVPPKVRFYK